MQLLVDENVHRLVIVRLRAVGYSVEWIKETMPGALDSDILARQDIKDLILITNDRDFGDLIFNQAMPPPLSILYTRMPHRLPDQAANRLIAVLDAGVAHGQMITLTKDGARSKSFPAGAQND